ncbi:unnamed protein product [Bursaphelenchus xylophilus]|nr:unnamed protein product [Bursaphelenchus xylophilus]CAG9130446.1 unnamed protein product [Bursaphelenchus xylophilus]
MAVCRVLIVVLVLSTSFSTVLPHPSNSKSPVIPSMNFDSLSMNPFFSQYRRNSEFLQKRDVEDIYQMDPYELGIKFGKKK